MKLDLYLYIKNHNFKMKDFCKLIGCRREKLSMIIHGRAKVTLVTALAIEKVTNGEIKKEYLMKQG